MTKQELFETHGKILLQAASRQGWRTMPEGGTKAIKEGLVQESDPTWMYSDDHRASNGFTLTDLGREIMVERGYICQCAGCVHETVRPHGDQPAVLPELPGRHPAVRDDRDSRGHQLQVPCQDEAG